MAKALAPVPESTPAATFELPFFEVGVVGNTHNLFTVNRGVPLSEALDQALMFMHTSNDLLNVIADDPGMSERLSWGVNYLNQMARATVASVMSALDAAEEAT